MTTVLILIVWKVIRHCSQQHYFSVSFEISKTHRKCENKRPSYMKLIRFANFNDMSKINVQNQ